MMGYPVHTFGIIVSLTNQRNSMSEGLSHDPMGVLYCMKSHWPGRPSWGRCRRRPPGSWCCPYCRWCRFRPRSSCGFNSTSDLVTSLWKRTLLKVLKNLIFSSDCNYWTLLTELMLNNSWPSHNQDRSALKTVNKGSEWPFFCWVVQKHAYMGLFSMEKWL